MKVTAGRRHFVAMDAALPVDQLAMRNRDHRPATRSQDAPDLAKRNEWIGQMLENFGTYNHIDGCISEGQMTRVGHL